MYTGYIIVNLREYNWEIFDLLHSVIFSNIEEVNFNIR